MKHCPQCERDLPTTAFGLDNNRVDKLHPWCKECKNRKGREKWASDPEHRASKSQKSKEYLSDPVKREEQKARNKAWREERLATDPEYRAIENERNSWDNRTPEQKQRKVDTNREWREANREHVNKQHREYVMDRYHNDAEFKKGVRDWFTRRRNTKRANGGEYTSEEWDSMCLLVGGRCVACGQITKLEVDHVIPVSQGGRNDIDNIQPLCRSCNASKGPNEMDYRPMTLVGAMRLTT